MALFGSKKKTVEEKAVKPVKAVKAKVVKAPKEVKATKAVTSVAVAHTGITHVKKGVGASIIVRPRVTEKTHFLAEGFNVYVFNVKLGATKGMVSEAVRDLFKVSPVKVSIVPVPKKHRFVKGKMGVSGGGRKAYVYLNKTDKLELA